MLHECRHQLHPKEEHLGWLPKRYKHDFNDQIHLLELRDKIQRGCVPDPPAWVLKSCTPTVGTELLVKLAKRIPSHASHTAKSPEAPNNVLDG